MPSHLRKKPWKHRWFPLRRTLFAGMASVSSSLRSCGAFSSRYSRRSRRLRSNPSCSLYKDI